MNPKRVLIVDDDIDLVEAMRLTLEQEGFEVLDAQSGDKGLERLLKDKPDLVILDVMMGTQDEGFHVAYKMRQTDVGKDIPIIMLTAVAQETGFHFDTQKDQEFLPVNEFVEKPVAPQTLIDLVKKHLGS